MPDITMCRGDGCPKKGTCYRFTATPDKYWQAYFCGIPFGDEKEGACMHYMPDWRKVKEAGRDV